MLGLLGRLRDKMCSVRRDRIFSSLSLCSEGSRIEVDYEIDEVRLMCRVLEASTFSSCICCAAILVHALDLASVLTGYERDAPRFGEDFAEFQVRGYRLSASALTGQSRTERLPERWLGCTVVVGSQWRQDGVVMICVSMVCSDTLGYIFWWRPGYTRSDEPDQCADCVYLQINLVEDKGYGKSLGRMGTHVTIAPSGNGYVCNVRLTLSALLEVCREKDGSAQALALCNLSFRHHGCKLLFHKETRR
jgi:hypothetical protein